MPRRLRSVLARPGRDRVSGAVEVDETYIGAAPDRPDLPVQFIDARDLADWAVK